MKNKNSFLLTLISLTLSFFFAASLEAAEIDDTTALLSGYEINISEEDPFTKSRPVFINDFGKNILSFIWPAKNPSPKEIKESKRYKGLIIDELKNREPKTIEIDLDRDKDSHKKMWKKARNAINEKNGATKNKEHNKRSANKSERFVETNVENMIWTENDKIDRYVNIKYQQDIDEIKNKDDQQDSWLSEPQEGNVLSTMNNDKGEDGGDSGSNNEQQNEGKSNNSTAEKKEAIKTTFVAGIFDAYKKLQILRENGESIFPEKEEIEKFNEEYCCSIKTDARTYTDCEGVNFTSETGTTPTVPPTLSAPQLHYDFGGKKQGEKILNILNSKLMIDCVTSSQLLWTVGIINVLGKDKFDEIFNETLPLHIEKFQLEYSGIMTINEGYAVPLLYTLSQTSPLLYFVESFKHNIAVNSKIKFKAGNMYMWTNHDDYRKKHPNGTGYGYMTICTKEGNKTDARFVGYGFAKPLSVKEIKTVLRDSYNEKSTALGNYIQKITLEDIPNIVETASFDYEKLNLLVKDESKRSTAYINEFVKKERLWLEYYKLMLASVYYPKTPYNDLRFTQTFSQKIKPFVVNMLKKAVSEYKKHGADDYLRTLDILERVEKLLSGAVEEWCDQSYKEEQSKAYRSLINLYARTLYELGFIYYTHKKDYSIAKEYFLSSKKYKKEYKLLKNIRKTDEFIKKCKNIYW